MKKYDVFVMHCQDYDGTVVSIAQYISTMVIDGTGYFLTWHTNADSEIGLLVIILKS